MLTQRTALEKWSVETDQLNAIHFEHNYHENGASTGEDASVVAGMECVLGASIEQPEERTLLFG